MCGCHYSIVIITLDHFLICTLIGCFAEGLTLTACSPAGPIHEAIASLLRASRCTSISNVTTLISISYKGPVKFSTLSAMIKNTAREEKSAQLLMLFFPPPASNLNSHILTMQSPL